MASDREPMPEEEFRSSMDSLLDFLVEQMCGFTWTTFGGEQACVLSPGHTPERRHESGTGAVIHVGLG